MINQDSDLKIADFGYAAPANGRDGKGFLHTKLGTKSYIAPEIWKKVPYIGQSADVFSCAVILFIMVTGKPPFLSAESKDPHYKCFIQNKPHIFWNAQSKSKPEGFFSEDFKELINSCFSIDPFDRPSINELQCHPWMNQETATKEEVIVELEKRRKGIIKVQEREKALRKLEKVMKD